MAFGIGRTMGRRALSSAALGLVGGQMLTGMSNPKQPVISAPAASMAQGSLRDPNVNPRANNPYANNPYAGAKPRKTSSMFGM
jgi:hypothetical protein